MKTNMKGQTIDNAEFQQGMRVGNNPSSSKKEGFTDKTTPASIQPTLIRADVASAKVLRIEVQNKCISGDIPASPGEVNTDVNKEVAERKANFRSSVGEPSGKCREAATRAVAIIACETREGTC